jgi:hypothetical protein
VIALVRRIVADDVVVALGTRRCVAQPAVTARGIRPTGRGRPGSRRRRRCAARCQSLLASLGWFVTRLFRYAPEVARGGLSASSGPVERSVICVGVPAGQQVERIRVPAAGYGTARDEVQALVGFEFHGLVGERHLPDERVVQALGADAVPPDFVLGLALPEGVAAGRQLAD